MLKKIKPQTQEMKKSGSELQSIINSSEEDKQQINRWKPWNQFQKHKFAAFIQFFKHQLRIGKRKSSIVFKLMSKYIKTKSFNQCRTFFYQIQKQFKNIENLLISIKSEFNSDGFFETVCQLKKQILQISLLNNKYKVTCDIALNTPNNKTIPLRDKSLKLPVQNDKCQQKQLNSSEMKTRLKFKRGQQQNKQEDKTQFIYSQKNKEKQQNQILLNSIQLISKQQLLAKCNYHWQQWLKSTLEINRIKELSNANVHFMNYRLSS